MGDNTFIINVGGSSTKLAVSSGGNAITEKTEVRGMITSIAQIFEEVEKSPRLRIVTAAARETELLVAHQAQQAGLADFTLIGDEKLLRRDMEAHGIPADSIQIIDQADEAEAAKKAMHMVRDKQADMPMKGLLHTSTFMRAALHKDYGIAHGPRISEISVFEGRRNRLQLLTDCAINISPDLDCKRQLIENAVGLAAELGYEMPKVALLGAVEVINPKMPDTLESAVLTQMNRRGQIKGCIVDGPLSLDNAISAEAARRKGIDSPVAGQADILVVPDLQSGNMLGKSLVHYADRPSASVICGTDIPLVMTSRTDKMENKLGAIAVACYRYGKQKQDQAII